MKRYISLRIRTSTSYKECYSTFFCFPFFVTTCVYLTEPCRRKYLGSKRNTKSSNWAIYLLSIFIFVSSFVVLLSSGQEFWKRNWAKGAFKSYEEFDVNTSQTQTILILVICSVSLISSFLVVITKAQPELRLGILG